MFPIAILAGGLATRLRPITENIPKALIEVAGRPFIEWQLEQLCAQGFDKVILCTGYLGEMLESVVGDGRSFGLQVIYSHDGENLLGTGGALKKAAPLLGNAFFVLYGDSYLPIDFKKVERAFRASRHSGILTVLANSNRWDKSNALLEYGMLIEYNKHKPSSKMRHIDYGLAILKTDCLTQYSQGNRFDLADLYHELSINDDLQAYEVYRRFYEIGSHAGLAETEKYLLKRGVT